MDDGIYIIRRARQSYSAEKSLTVSAYNDQNLGIKISLVSSNCPHFNIATAAYWASGMTAGKNAHMFIQPDQLMYLQPYDATEIKWQETTIYMRRVAQDSNCLFTFATPTATGTIQKVSLCHYSMGKCKTQISIGGTTYYGEVSKTTRIFDWEQTDYTKKPNGAAWSWADLAAGKLKAGMFLYNMSDPANDVTAYGKFWYGSGILRYFKVLVECLLSNGTTQTIELIPTGTASSNCTPVSVCPIWNSQVAKGWWTQGAHDFPILSSITGVDYWTSKLVTDRTYESDLSEVPPPFSKINGITVALNYKDYTEVSGYVKIFIRVRGTKYYDSAQAFGSDLTTMKTRTKTWTTNPATGAAWTYEDAQGLRFGVDYHGGAVGVNSLSRFTQLYIYSLTCTTKYQEQPETAELVPVDYDRIDYLKRVQKLPIVPDELQFGGPFISPLTELVLYVAGVPKFQGVVWRCTEINSSGRYKIYAKSTEALLNYRYIPSFFYDAKNVAFEKIYTVADLLSDARPTYPNFRCMGKALNCGTVFADSGWTTPSGTDWMPYEGIVSDYIHQYETAVGLLYILNSYIPKLPTTAGKLAGIDLKGRAIMTMNRSPEASPTDYFYSSELDEDWGVVDQYAITQDLAQGVDDDVYGSVRRLQFRATTAPSNGQYYTDGQDSYISDDCWPGTLRILADHIFDTYIRPDVQGFDKKYISIPFDYGGMASAVIESVLQKIGAELQFLPQFDCTVKMLVADEVGRGSADAPIASFIDGVNCKIKPPSSQNLPPNHIIGHSIVPGISSDFAPSKGVPIIRVVQENAKTGDELQEYLDALRPQENDYQITCYRGEWLLDPYDWISVTVGGVTESVRIADMSVSDGVTTIKAGSYSSAQEKFLEWKALREDLDDVYQYNLVKFESDTPAVSTSFTVDAARLAEEDWRCMLNVNWETVAPSYLITGDALMSHHFSVSGNYTGSAAMTVKFADYRNALYIEWTVVGTTETGRIFYEAYDQTGKFPTSVTLRGVKFSTDGDDDDVLGCARDLYTYITVYPVKSYSVSPDQMFLKVTLNGKVIPPGRMDIMDFSGSTQIDISKHCVAGTNTLSLAIVNGVTKTATASGQAISGKVAQTRRLTVMQNA